MNKNTFLIVLLLTVVSCSKSIKPEQFEGIWMSDRQNYYYTPDTTYENTTLSQGFPFIIDFIDNENALVKFFGYKTINFKWAIEKDSTLKIDKHNYRIKLINKDTITLNLKKEYEEYTYNLFRIKDSQLDYDSSQIANYLTSVIWNESNIDPSSINKLKFHDYIEYLDNYGKLMKYWMPKSYESKDSFLNFQLDNWAIGEYKKHFFISEHFSTIGGLPNYWNLKQILEINDSILSIFTTQYHKNEIQKYYGFTSKSDIDKKRDQLIGLWKSKNSIDSSYGEHLPEKSINAGRVGKYNDYLFYKIDSIHLYQYGNNTDTIKSEWMLNKDGSAIIYIFHHEFSGRKVIIHTISEITNLTDNKLSMNLFNNNWLSGLTDKHRNYILNSNQNFERIKETKQPTQK